MNDYRAPWWQWGGNLQTIAPALWARRHQGPVPRFTRERWSTPDGDFIDVDFLAAPGATPDGSLTAAPVAAAPTPWLVLFHGLEGSSASHYAQAFATEARARGLPLVVPHFRGCSGELNLAPRAYHSGDFEEIGWILQRLRQSSGAPLWAAGVSLGGNALLRWAQEAGTTAAATVAAVAAVSAPLDLGASGRSIDRGFNRLAYTRMFLRTMKPKALRKWQQHPGLFDRDRLRAAGTLYEFDDLFTAPLHGFRSALDYYERASAAPHLGHIRVPALVLNALNDPFVPGASLPRTAPPPVTLWQPAHGGHVGFGQGAGRGDVLAMPRAVLDWMHAAKA